MIVVAGIFTVSGATAERAAPAVAALAAAGFVLAHPWRDAVGK